MFRQQQHEEIRHNQENTDAEERACKEKDEEMLRKLFEAK
jgi:hypothetical protein